MVLDEMDVKGRHNRDTSSAMCFVPCQRWIGSDAPFDLDFYDRPNSSVRTVIFRSPLAVSPRCSASIPCFLFALARSHLYGRRVFPTRTTPCRFFFFLSTSSQSQLQSRTRAEAFLSRPFRRALRRQSTSLIFFSHSFPRFLRRFSFRKLRSFHARLCRTSSPPSRTPREGSLASDRARCVRDACARSAAGKARQLVEHVPSCLRSLRSS